MPIKKYVNVSAAVIVNKSEGTEKVLLIQRSKEDHWGMHWEFPRGKCDKGVNEDIMKCLVREVKEETNLNVKPLRLIDKFDYIAGKDAERLTTQYNFLCFVEDGDFDVILSDEHMDHRWISGIGEAELLLNTDMRKTLHKTFDQSLVSVEENVEAGSRKEPNPNSFMTSIEDINNNVKSLLADVRRKETKDKR